MLLHSLTFSELHFLYYSQSTCAERADAVASKVKQIEDNFIFKLTIIYDNIFYNNRFFRL